MFRNKWAVMGLAAAAMGLGRADTLTVESAPGRQISGLFSRTVSQTTHLRFLLYTPGNYRKDGSDSWPLVLFLHGSGERGTNVHLVAAHGPPKLVEEGREFPFLLVSPQCPPEEQWRADDLAALLDDLAGAYRVDAKRVYVTGLSMGGYGTWDLAVKYPERLAAVAPICGGGDRLAFKIAGKKKEALKTLGVWAFHGGKDPVVPLADSEQMVEEFKRLGSKDVTLTVFPEAGHDSWSEAYAKPELYDWLLRHHR